MQRRPAPKLLDFVPGRFLSVSDISDGVYCVRIAGEPTRDPWVTHVHASTDRQSFARVEGFEVFHLEGDEPGRPTRWDSERLHEIAKRNGWRDPSPTGARDDREGRRP